MTEADPSSEYRSHLDQPLASHRFHNFTSKSRQICRYQEDLQMSDVMCEVSDVPVAQCKACQLVKHRSYQRTHLIVKKDEVHLYEDEGHPRGRRQGQQHVVTVRVPLQFPILTKLQPGVDH